MTKATKIIKSINHTTRAYAGLNEAYQHFNKALFKGELPSCIITLQRKSKAYGYYHAGIFKDGEIRTDEIAMNPQTFEGRKHNEILSTLAHEMCHLWQQHLGKAPKRAYHDKQWAKKMLEIGLLPYNVKDKSKQTGPNCSHYIEHEKAFYLACAKFLAEYDFAVYSDIQSLASKLKKKAKAKSKTKYTCNHCGINAWAKPHTALICGNDRHTMVEQDQDEDDEESEAA